MKSLFNYNTLNVSLEKKTRSLLVSLNRRSRNNALNLEMVFELETVLSWATGHLEISSILLRGEGEIFSEGIDLDELAKMDKARLLKLQHRIQKLTLALFYLPQTVIIDLKKGAGNMAAELAIGADIRLAHRQTKLQFNHVEQGLTPACGGIGPLSMVVPLSFARKWILGALPVDNEELSDSGFIANFYKDSDHGKIINRYLHTINKQSPVARIQAKRGLLEAILPELERAREYEKTFASGNACTDDWKEFIKAQKTDQPPQFSSPLEICKIINNSADLPGGR